MLAVPVADLDVVFVSHPTIKLDCTPSTGPFILLGSSMFLLLPFLFDVLGVLCLVLLALFTIWLEGLCS